MTANVLLIAVGGIGFRHFQALLNCESDFELHVLDLNTDTIERAKAYAAEQLKPIVMKREFAFCQHHLIYRASGF